MVFFALNDEQRALRDTVRDYVTDRFSPAEVRKVYDDPQGDAAPAELWKAFAEQGLFAVLVPDEHDGLGMGMLEAAVVARVLGAGVIPAPWLATVLGAEAIRLAGSAEQQASWLPRVAAGEAKLSPALNGPGGSWDAAGVDVTVDGGSLRGTASMVEQAGIADALVVAARDGEQVALFLVDPTSDGVTLTRHETLDRTTRLYDVVLDGASGEKLENGSEEVLAQLFNRGALLVANDLVGLARQALTLTVEYDRERMQFGRPVGSFQALKHGLADLHVAVTMAEHAALYAAHALDEDLPDAQQAVHVAKAKASDSARDTVYSMVQFFGGIGFTWEHDAHFYFKRAKRQEFAYGDAAEHRERLAALLIDRA